MASRALFKAMADRLGAPPSLLLRNIAANYAYVVVMGVTTLVVIPIYLRTLGSTEWGIVALCGTAQGMLLLLDAGLGQIMPREVARAAVHGGEYAVYRAFARTYGTLALAAFAIGQLAASWLVPLIADAAGERALPAFRLVLVQFLFQFLNSAALGYWNGRERQTLVNLRCAGFSLTKHALAVTLVTQWEATAVVYMAPFAAITAMECCANWLRIRREAGPHAKEAPVIAADRMLVSAGGFGAAVVVGMLTSQIDRLVLVGRVSVEDFGTYSVAATLGLAFMQLQTPVVRAFLPRATAAESPAEVIVLMLKTLMVVCVLPCIVAAVLAQPILTLWLGDRAIAMRAAGPFQLITLAVALNALYNAPYVLLLRENQYGRVVAFNCVALLLQVSLLLFTVPKLSILAGGWSWLLLGVAQVLFGAFTLRRVLAGKSARTGEE